MGQKKFKNLSLQNGLYSFTMKLLTSESLKFLLYKTFFTSRSRTSRRFRLFEFEDRKFEFFS